MTLKPNEHVTAWIGAYYDGELAGDLLRKVEDHLGACITCQAELEALGALSAVLHDAPMPTRQYSSDVYASRVMLRLPREQKRGMGQRAKMVLPVAWRYAPAGLFLGWAFFQAALLVSGAVLWLIRAVPQVRASLGWLLPLAESEPGGWLEWIEIINPLLLADLALTLFVSLLFAAWLASWFAVHRRPGPFEEQKV